MSYFFLVGGFICLIAGFFYLYYPQKIFQFHRWVKENFLADSVVLARHRKTGLLFLIFGLLLAYLAISLF